MRRTAYLLVGLIVWMTGAAWGAQLPSGKIAYTQRGWLYAVEIERNGNRSPGRVPVKICRVLAHGQMGSLSWSADGRYLTFSTEKERPTGDTKAYVWIVEAKAGAKARIVALGDEPEFAPDGHLLVFTSTLNNGGVSTFDLDTRVFHLLRKNAIAPRWSGDGKEILLLENVPDDNRALLVVDAATGRRVAFRKDGGISLSTALLSPNGRYIAHDLHLSRPTLTGEVVNRATGQSFSLPSPGEPVLEWSPDSRWLLWTRLVDDEDGNHLWAEVWIITADGYRSHKIGRGEEAHFAPDGKHILYVRQTQTGKRAHKRVGLYVTDLQGKRQKRVVRQIDGDFAVWRQRHLPDAGRRR